MFRWSNGGTGVAGGQNVTIIDITAGDTVSTLSSIGGLSGFIYISGVGSTTQHKRVTGQVNYMTPTTFNVGGDISGRITTTTAINAIKFFYNATTIVSGVIRVYGIQN